MTRTTRRTWLFCGYFVAIGGGLTVYLLRAYVQLAVAHRIWPILLIVTVAILFQGLLGIALGRYVSYVSKANHERSQRR